MTTHATKERSSSSCYNAERQTPPETNRPDQLQAEREREGTNSYLKDELVEEQHIINSLYSILYST